MLRRLALETLRDEQGNLEGAAAFATIALPPARSSVVRAAVAFQAIYDYVDTLAEQPNPHPRANARQLHRALFTALTPAAPHTDYYAHHDRREDGYLRALVAACRGAIATLPATGVIEPAAQCALKRMIEYQVAIHGPDPAARLESWARPLTPATLGLRWWEAAAGGASSLIVFALLAAASDALLSQAEVAELEAAYFPWAGALHVLFDSLVDGPDDGRGGHHSLVAHYADAQEAAARMDAIAQETFGRARRLQLGHTPVLAAMCSYYLSCYDAPQPDGRAIRSRIVARLGPIAYPTLAILRLRRAIARPHHERAREDSNL